VAVRRGQVVLVELDPAVGAEQGKVRPAIVVSNDGANRAAARANYGVVTVVPLTRTLNQTGRERPYQTTITPEESGLDHLSVAQGEQVRSMSIGRVVRSVGRLTAEAMARVDAALRVHLSL
jgi:mRNA interferase MazF